MRPTSPALLLALALGCATAPPARAPVAGEDPAVLLARCDHGFASSCLALGRSHLLGAVAGADERTGAALVISACELGDPAACGDLGVLHAVGKAVTQDDGRAAALSRRACEGGAAHACSNLGALVLAGAAPAPGARREGADDARLLRYFRAGCDAAVPEGCVNLGTLLAQGRLVPRDPVAAGRALRRACELGSGLGCHRFAQLVEESPQAAPDLTPAALFARACAVGVAPACAAANEQPASAGARTPSPRLVAERDSLVLGIPGAGGFHPGELAPVAAGVGRSLEDVRRPTAGVLAAVPAALRARLGVDGEPRGDAGDPAVERLVALRRSQLLACHQAPREKRTAVEVHAVFDVDPSGFVSVSRAASVEADGALEACVADAVGAWEFPRAAGFSGPFHVAQRFEPPLAGPPPAQPEVGWLKAAQRDPGCVERKLRVPPDYRGASGAVTVRLAVDGTGTPGLVHPLGAAPDAIVAAVADAVRSCRWAPGADPAGRPAATWITLTVKLAAR